MPRRHKHIQNLSTILNNVYDRYMALRDHGSVSKKSLTTPGKVGASLFYNKDLKVNLATNFGIF